MNLANSRRIRRKDIWSITATDTKPNTAYDTYKLIVQIIIINFNF
jgi:hypothetical protein